MCAALEPQLAAEAAGTAQLPPPLAKSWCPSHPSTLRMVIEVLQAQNEKKGMSVFAIKRFILAKYPTVDPIRLKYLLKQALVKGLSRGDLMRPRNSSAVGATGRFMLAPKKLQHKHSQGQKDPDGGAASKPGQKGTTKPPTDPAAGAAKKKQTVKKAKEKPAAAKEEVKEKMEKKASAVKEKVTAAREKVRQPAAAKPRNEGAKPPQAAGHPGQGPSQPPMALAAEDAGGGSSASFGGARAKVTRKVPAGKSKGKVPKGEQQDAPKAKAAQGKARKPQATPEAGQGKAGQQKAAPGASKGKAGQQKAAPEAGQGKAGKQKAAGRKAP